MLSFDLNWIWLAAVAIFVVPIAGGLLAGIDRKITARMQSRKGPPLLQPFYDFFKLLQKDTTTINPSSRFYVILSLVFMILTVVIFACGFDILLVVFALTLSAVCLVLAGYSAGSPYSHVGAERELLQIMAYEPMVIIAAVSFYLSTGFFGGTATFNIHSIMNASMPAIVTLPLIFAGFVYVLTFKLRKSPFDLSMSHHGHQELVKGLSTELTGSSLAVLELIHWYESILVLGFVYLFFSWSWGWSWIIGLGACIIVYFLEILLDNAFARVKWQAALKVSWVVTAFVSIINLVVLQILRSISS